MGKMLKQTGMCLLLSMTACGMFAMSAPSDSLRIQSPGEAAEAIDQPGYWYVGAGYSVPFMFGDLSSLTADRHFWGNKGSLKGGYRFSSIFGIEAGISFGRMRGFSPRSAADFRLGTEDAMTYYPYTILGGSDNYQTAPGIAGIWENRGNNVYIKSVPYSSIYAESRYWEGSLQAVLNLNRLFMRVPEGREQPVTLLMKPGIYLQKFSAAARDLGFKERIAPKQSPLSVGLGGDVALHIALNRSLALELSSGLVWVSKRNFDGVRTVRRAHDDFIWQSGLTLIWKFRRNAPVRRPAPTPVIYQEPVEEVEVARPNPFEGGDFAFDYLQPDLSGRKERSMSRQAHLLFDVAKTDIRPDLGDNRAELGKIDEAFGRLADDADVSISSIDIDGYASPEGSHDLNLRLSRERAEAISGYIVGHFGYPASRIRATGHAEDWKGLENLLQDWDNPGRERALDILANIPDAASRQKLLKGLPVYRAMLSELYPQLRRNEYTFHYTVAPISLERAAELIYTRPDKLSAEEMIAVANRHPLFSKEFEECAAIAFEHYPEAPLARLYMGAIALRKGDTETADEYLAPLEDDPIAYNLLGVRAAMSENPEEAERYFRMAADQGDAAAIENLKKLER